MSIKGICRSNRDEFRGYYQWPQKFVAVPLLKENVKSNDGSIVLEVCGITHCVNKEGEPFIEIELTRRYYTG